MANSPANNKAELITMPGNTDKDNLACQLGFAITKIAVLLNKLLARL
jgi:hypothetical protein